MEFSSRQKLRSYCAVEDLVRVRVQVPIRDGKSVLVQMGDELLGVATINRQTVEALVPMQSLEGSRFLILEYIDASAALDAPVGLVIEAGSSRTRTSVLRDQMGHPRGVTMRLYPVSLLLAGVATQKSVCPDKIVWLAPQSHCAIRMASNPLRNRICNDD